jgi:hypothetical protein
MLYQMVTVRCMLKSKVVSNEGKISISCYSFAGGR